MHIFFLSSFLLVCLFRSCWLAAKKVKERSRTAWRWCSVFQRKPTMPCTCPCWKVINTHHWLLMMLWCFTFSCICTEHTCCEITTLNKSGKMGFFLKNFNANITLVLPGFDENIESQGELILQESFQVWDPKTLIRKGRERHLFLFEMSLVFSKEVKDSNGRSKYIYKSKLFVSRWWWNVRNDRCLVEMVSPYLTTLTEWRMMHWRSQSGIWVLQMFLKSLIGLQLQHVTKYKYCKCHCHYSNHLRQFQAS